MTSFRYWQVSVENIYNSRGTASICMILSDPADFTNITNFVCMFKSISV